MASAREIGEGGGMDASQLQELIVATLVRREGGSARAWRLALGRIRLHDRATHPDVNWSAVPQGNARENAAIEQVLDEIRLSHSLVNPD